MPFENAEVWALAADLADAPLEVQAKAREAVAHNTELMARDAKAFAPVRTGYLRAKITATAAGLAGVVTSEADYGGYVEYGTSDTPSQPYLRPAGELAAPRLEDDLADIGSDIL